MVISMPHTRGPAIDADKYKQAIPVLFAELLLVSDQLIGQ